MEEYEVELIDYLRVIWKGKWIILGCFVAAVAVAVAISLSQPNRYETKGAYKLSSFPQLDSISINMVSKVDALAILRSRDLIEKVVASEEFAQLEWPENMARESALSWIVAHIEAENPEGDLIRLSIAGFKSPQWLKDVLSQTVREFEWEIRRRMVREIEQEESWLETNRQLLLARQRDIEAEIDKEVSSLEVEYERQIASIQERIRLIEQESPADLLVGENNATLQGYMVREKYRSLIERLLPLQGQLDELPVNKRAFFPQLYSDLDSLDNRIQDTKEKLARLEQLKLEFQEDSLSLVVFENPYAPESPLGPNRSLNIAVAGILGLFVGTLLAFLWEYIAAKGRKGGSQGSKG